MTGSNDGEKTPLQPDAGKGEYVGYRRPPELSRFKKGKSGNPLGKRKKQHATSHSLLLSEAAKVTRVKEGRRHVLMTTERLMYAHLILRAAKGDIPSMKDVFKIMKAFEQKRGFGNVEWNKEPYNWGDKYRELKRQLGQESDDEMGIDPPKNDL